MSGSYNAGSIDASLRLDRSDFNRELGQAKKDAEEFQKQKYTPKVSLDTSDAALKLRELKQGLQDLHDFSVSISLTGLTESRVQLDALLLQMKEINDTHVVVQTRVDDTASVAALAALNSTITDLNNRQINVRADVNTTAAAASMIWLNDSIDALNAQRIDIQADVDTAAALARLAALRAEIDELNGTRVTPGGGDPDSGTPGPGVPGNNKKKDKDGGGLASKLFSLPGLIAAVSPQIPALTNLLLGATAAVASFGVAAGGAFGIYGAATMGAVKQAGAHKQAVDQTSKALETAQARLAKTTAGTQSYKDALKAATEAEKAHRQALNDLTPAEKQFNTALDGSKTAWKSFIGATEVYTLKPVSTVLQGATAALPKFIPLVKEMAPVVGDIATHLKNWMAGDGLVRFVTFLRTYGVPIIKNTVIGFRGFLTAGGALVRAFGPIAEHMSQYIKRIGEAADRWGKNGGAERFRARFQASWVQLRPIFVELIKFARTVWEVLQGTGKTNGSALADTLHSVNMAIGNIKPAAVKAFSEIFQSLSDVAVTLAPVIGITSKAIVDIVNALPPGTIRAIADAMIAWKLAVIGWNAAVMLWGILVGVIEAVQTAWMLLSIAFALSPLGVIITLVVGLIAVIVLIALKTTWFQTAWKYTWNAVKAAALWAWGYIGPVFMWIGNAWWTVAKLMWTVYSTIFKVVWEAVAASAMWLWGILKPIFVFIGQAWWFMAKLTWTIWSTVFKVVFILFEAAFKALWIFGIKPVIGWITTGWHALGDGVMWVWHHILKPAWDGVASGAAWLWNHGIKPAVGKIEDGWHALGDGVMWVWKHLLKPGFDAVGDGATRLWKSYIAPVFDGIKNTISSKWDWIKKWVFSPMGDFFTKKIPGWADTMKGKLITAFDTAWKGIQKVWDNVKKAIGSPIYLVAKYVWNDAIYSIMDKISGFVHQKNPLGKINTGSIPHFAAGGPVKGGTKGKDSVLSMLMPEEHVLTREDVTAMGGHQSVQRFRSALHGGKPVQGANSSGAFGLGGWIESAGSALSSTVGKGIGALKDAVMGAVGVVANPLLNAAEKTVDKLIPNTNGWNSLAAGTMKQPIESIKKWINKQDSKAQSVGGVIPSGQHLAFIDAALKAAGVPPPGSKAQWEAGMNTLIARESGWNASAINNWDSNAKAGHPSQGLTQTIPSTFAAYVPASLRSRGILDPIANIAASVRYIKSVYGGIQNVQQANASKAPKGYWTGTDGAAPGYAWVGEKGPELVNFHGGEVVHNHIESMQMAGTGHLPGYASGTAKQRSIVRRTYHERDSDTNRRNAAQKSYNAAHTKYLNATTAKEQAAARKEMDKYEKRISNANKEIAADNKLITLHNKKYKAASDAVRRERQDAETLAAARKKANDARVSAARTAAQNFVNNAKAGLDAKIATATDARNSYYDTAVQSGNLSGLTGNRAAGFTQQLQAKITAIQNFQANLHKLATLGVSQGVIQQIAAMGADQGGQLAQSLARTTTSADAKSLNAKYAELEKVSGTYADSAANDGYGLSSLKAQSAVLSKTKITVTAPDTILVNIDGKTFKAHTERVVEAKVTEIVAAAGKKK